ncbi:hypothetical protein JT358_12670 [Micrococcales bacterium 31B]|nr:hypothetical protein [Micrococcales bacterium 31B]
MTTGAWHGFRIGWRSARSTRDRAGQFVAVLLAVLCLGFTASIPGVTHAVYAGVQQRDELRAPIAFDNVDSGTPTDTRGAYYYTGTSDTNILVAQPLGSEAPPRGLTAWPEPGETYLSPALAAKYPQGTLSPWGLVAGTVGEAGLTHRDEKWGVANPRVANLFDAKAIAVPSRGFGPPARTPITYNSESETGFHAVSVALLVLPAAAFAWVLVSVSMKSRRAAVRALRSMGARRSFLVSMLLGEAAPPAVAAVVLLTAGLYAATYAPLTIPVVNYYLMPADLRASRPWLLAAPSVAALLVVMLFCGRSLRFTRALHRARKHRLKWLLRPQVAALLAPVSLLAISQNWSSLAPEMLRPAIFPGLVFILVATAPVALYVPLRALLATRRRRTSNPDSLVSSASATDIRTLPIGVSIAMAGALVVCAALQLFGSTFGDAVRASERTFAQFGDRAVLITLPTTAGAAFREDLARTPELHALSVDFTPATAQRWSNAIFVGHCADLSALSLPCDAGDTPQVVGSARDELFRAMALRYTSDSDPYFVRNLDVNAVEQTSADALDLPMLVFGTDTGSIDTVAISALAVDHGGMATVLGGSGNAELTFQHIKWLLLFAPVALTFLTLTVAYNAWQAMLRRNASALPLTLLWRRPSLLWSLSRVHVLLPLGVGIAVGLATYWYLGAFLGGAYENMFIDYPTFIAIAVTSIGACVAFWGLSTRALISRITTDPIGTLS